MDAIFMTPESRTEMDWCVGMWVNFRSIIGVFMIFFNNPPLIFVEGAGVQSESDWSRRCAAIEFYMIETL